MPFQHSFLTQSLYAFKKLSSVMQEKLSSEHMKRCFHAPNAVTRGKGSISKGTKTLRHGAFHCSSHDGLLLKTVPRSENVSDTVTIVSMRCIDQAMFGIGVVLAVESPKTICRRWSAFSARLEIKLTLHTDERNYKEARALRNVICKPDTLLFVLRDTVKRLLNIEENLSLSNSRKSCSRADDLLRIRNEPTKSQDHGVADDRCRMHWQREKDDDREGSQNPFKLSHEVCTQCFRHFTYSQETLLLRDLRTVSY